MSKRIATPSRKPHQNNDDNPFDLIYHKKLAEWPKFFKLASYKSNYSISTEDILEFNQFIDGEFMNFIDHDTSISNECKKMIFQKALRETASDYLFISRWFHWIDDYFKDPNDPVKLIRLQCIASFTQITNSLYMNGFILKMLQSDDLNVIQALFWHPVDIKGNINQDLLPLDLICKTLQKVNQNRTIQGFLNIRKNIIKLGQLVIKRSYLTKNFYTKFNRDDFEDFQLNPNMILPKKLTLEFVRSAIQIVRSDDNMEEEALEEIESLILLLCYKTFQNLEIEDIMKLKDDYIQMLPCIFKYMRPIERIRYHWSGGRRAKIVEEATKCVNDLFYLKKYYGSDLIEKESFNIYLELIKKPVESDIQLHSIIGLWWCVIDSKLVYDHLDSIYEILIQTNHLKNSTVLKLLTKLIGGYSGLTLNQFTTLYTFLSKEKSLLGHTTKTLNYQNISSLFVVVLSKYPEWTLKKLTFILNKINISNPNAVTLINKFLCAPEFHEIFISSKDFKKFHERIMEISKMSLEHGTYLLEYLMKHETYASLAKMSKSISSCINSNKKWMVRDDHFFQTLLVYYKKLIDLAPQAKHKKDDTFSIFEKIIRAFVKTLQEQTQEISLDIIYSYEMNEKESAYLFKQINEILKSPSTVITIFKYFIDLGEHGQNQVLDFLKKVGFSDSFRTCFDNLVILDGLKSYINIDQQIKLYLQALYSCRDINLIRNFYRSQEILKHIASILGSLTDLWEFYPTLTDNFIDCYFPIENENPEKMNIFAFFCQMLTTLHEKVFKSVPKDSANLIAVHEHLVKSIFTKPGIQHLKLNVITNFFGFFKPLKTIDASLQKSVIETFKQLNMSFKISVLRYIRNNQITVLEFLNEPSVTGVNCRLEPISVSQETAFNSTAPYVQNLIVKKILVYLFREFEHREEASKIHNLHSYALVSKTFFMETCKLFKSMDFYYAIFPKFAITKNQWSFAHLGIYKLDYFSLSPFNYQIIDDIFYNLSSLQISIDFYYLVNKEMVNLVELKVCFEASLAFSSVYQLMVYCHKLERVKFDIKPESVPFTKNLEKVITTLFQNNRNTLELLKIHYTATEETKYVEELKPIFKLLHKNEKEMHNSGKAFKLETKCICALYYDEEDDPVDSNSTNDMLKIYAKNCTILRLDNEDSPHPQFYQTQNFKRLHTLDMELFDDDTTHEKIFMDFLASPLVRIKTLIVNLQNSLELDFCQNTAPAIKNMMYLETLSLSVDVHIFESILPSLKYLFTMINEIPSMKTFNINFNYTSKEIVSLMFDSFTPSEFGKFVPVNTEKSKFIKIN
ncbi:hypothetical protein DLAC_00603 [Tieghemostelium lacteum]|uniref:Uncharacterized protein n=1 Tax=Tieghemostelium lacteum TaxID=361077 RepID=A0A152AA58_TIELA|nr:hypothetical protein DLAC_00603 [Tieghemostelium lacteum]|eukprot:KYR03108.1 hypothetical protein DLAC_00603 [Tieghemostelium lacteum]